MLKRDNFNFLTEAPVPKVIGTLSVPTIISMLITTIYNMADTFFVGKIDTQSTAAVGIVFSVMFIIQSIAFFFGHGSGNYISRALGAQRHDDARQMATTGFVYAFAFGIIITIAGLIFLRPLAIALGATPTVLPPTLDYMSIILIGAPFMTAQFTLNGQMRFQGNAELAMLGVVVGAVMNVGLDPLLIFTLGMGVKGAAWATVIGQVSSFIILMALTHHGGNIRLHIKDFNPSWHFIKEIATGGTPSLMRQSLGSIASILLNVAASAYGDAAIAAMSIVNRIAMFIMSTVIGLGQGYQPLCGFCYGAKLYNRVKEGFWFCVHVGTVFLLACTVIGFAFSHSLIAVFRDDPQVITIGIDALRWQLITLPLCALSMYSNMMTQTAGMTKRANLLAASRRGIFFIPLIMILPHYFGITGVEACQAAADVCTFVLTVPVLRYTLRQLGQDKTHPKA
ncbi:MAG: MATE family efflux transporter [Muribaculaceae bacterium]|nr:MATE family efflux transporter [Muribaculaceae bacterium]